MWRRGEEVPGEQADYRKSRADYRAGDQSRTPGRPRQPPRLLHAASAQSYLLARAKLGFPMAAPELRDEVLAKLEIAE